MIESIRAKAIKDESPSVRIAAGPDDEGGA
jgi:hypothetical protein